MHKQVIGVTGATGFIGRNLIADLLQKGYRLKAFCIEDNPKLPKEVEIVHGNLATGTGLKGFTTNVDILIHLAAQVLPPEETMLRENVQGTYNLISSLTKPVKLIFNSSAAVYGSLESHKKHNESEELQPDTAYGLSKMVCEELITNFSAQKISKYIIFRPFNVYGPGNFKGVIFNFYKSIKKDGLLTLEGDGSQERDFLYIDDLVEAFTLSIEADVSGIFNLVTRKTVSINKLVETFKKVTKKSFAIKHSSSNTEKTGTIRQDAQLVKKQLGWESKTDLLTGLGKTINWYEKNPSPYSL